jgi:transposase
MLKAPDTLTGAERAAPEPLTRVGLLQRSYALARDFQQLVRTRKPSELEPWLQRASQTHLREWQQFATGIRQDLTATLAALTSPWSNGQTEGQVTKLKFYKQQMYGRAKLDLLRARMLHAT